MSASKAPRIQLSEYLSQLKAGDKSQLSNRVPDPGPAAFNGLIVVEGTDYFDQVVANRKLDSRPPLVKMAKRKMQAYLASQQPEPIGSHPVCNGVGFALAHGLLGLEDQSPLTALKTFMTQFLDA